jgi:hypothetical protein
VTRNSVIGKLHRANIPHVRPKVALKPRKRAVARAKSVLRAPPIRIPASVVPEIIVVQGIDPALHCDLMGLEDNVCHWPVADGLYCGGPVTQPRKPYCSIHARVSARCATMTPQQYTK